MIDHSKKITKYVIQGAVLLTVIGLVFWVAKFASGSETVRYVISRFGIAGIFFISLLSGFNLVVPIPAVTLLPLFEAVGHNFWVTVLVITLGMTTADSLAYFIGDFGRNLTWSRRSVRWLKRLDDLRERYYWFPVILLFAYSSLAPLPNEILIIPLGFLGYRFLHIFPAMFLGTLIFNFFYAKGITNLFNLI